MRISRIFISIVAVLSIVAGVMLVSAQEDAVQPYLGINIEPADEGAAVLRVIPGSPAADAGLERGDIITAVNGESVDAETLAEVVGALGVGDEVSLDVLRDDETMQLTATLAEQPERPERGRFPFGEFQMERPYLGVSLESTDDGVSIAAVSEASPAAEAGLQEGDIITAVNGEAVEEPADVASAIRNLAVGDTVTLSITRDGEAQDVTVPLDSMMSQIHTMLGDVVVYDGTNWQVISLSEDNALAEAGVQAGDVITAIDGNVYDPAGLNEYLDTLEDDATITLTIERDGETMDIAVNAADLDALNAFGFGRRGDGMPRFEFRGPRGEFMTGGVRLGVAYEDLNADVAAEHNLDVTEGALITEVIEDSPAAEAGLQVDDVVTAVNGDPVDAERTLRERLLAYEAGDAVTLDVLRAGESMSIEVTLAEVSLPGGMGEFPFDMGDGFRFFFGPDGEFNFPMPEIPRQPDAPIANV
jgi:S1-C subfamily serine protease